MSDPRDRNTPVRLPVIERDPSTPPPEAAPYVTFAVLEDLLNAARANSLWPLTAIDTAAVRNLLGGAKLAAMSRSPEIMADAAYTILTRPARESTGNFFIDELVLREAGVTDFSKYAPDANGPLGGDFFVPDEIFEAVPTKVVRAFV